jgi:hypothetical protein
MSYSKSLEMRIVRTKHVVSFYNGTCASDLLKDLGQVPKEAKVIKFEDACDNDPAESNPNRQHMIIFELEQNDNKNQKEE